MYRRQSFQILIIEEISSEITKQLFCNSMWKERTHATCYCLPFMSTFIDNIYVVSRHLSLLCVNLHICLPGLGSVSTRYVTVQDADSHERALALPKDVVCSSIVWGRPLLKSKKYTWMAKKISIPVGGAVSIIQTKSAAGMKAPVLISNKQQERAAQYQVLRRLMKPYFYRQTSSRMWLRNACIIKQFELLSQSDLRGDLTTITSVRIWKCSK